MRGGAIFVGDQPISVEGATFNLNNATDGGAIASFSQSKCRVLLCMLINELDSNIASLNNNVFTENTANVGSVLRALGDMNFIMENNELTDNKAEVGGDIATNPTHVKLTIYKVNEAFVFIDTASFDYIKQYPGTVSHLVFCYLFREIDGRV